MRALALAAVIACGCATDPVEASAPPDPLPSWNEGTAKRAIIDFVDRVTCPGPDFVPVDQRIAVFDNDGTLWVEKPLPVEVEFTLDRIKHLEVHHPEWRRRQPFASVLAGDIDAIEVAGISGLMELLAATHAGTTTDEFERIVSAWITTARSRRFDRLYTDLVYQPMLEVLGYFRAHGFTTYIVSGGGADFMRPWTQRVYGIPPQQVIGSRVHLKYAIRGGHPVIERLPRIDLIDDRDGKPIGIQQLIGRRPIAAFGNSDGDFEMLEWTTTGPGPRLGMLVHHTDAAREYAYDIDAHGGKLVRGLEEAPRRGWVIADMKRDWKTIFPDPTRRPTIGHTRLR